MQLNIHGVPVHGRVPRELLATFGKIESVTPSDIWKDIKAIYSTDKKGDAKGVCGTYASPNDDGKEPQAKVTLLYDDDSQEVFELKREHFPCIFIHSGKLDCEYWLAANILHELGHHHIKETGKPGEIKCHQFAMRYLDGGPFALSSGDFEFTYWGEAEITA